MTRIPRLFARRWARRAYFAADQEARQAWEEFADLDPAARRVALLWAADCERTMADTAFGFADADETDEDGFTLAQSLGMAALLLEMVADTEPVPGTSWAPARRSNLDDERPVADVLTALTQTSDVRARAVLTLTLHDVVVSRVGGQAAAALAAVVAYGYYRLSGMSDADARWLTGPAGPRWTR